LLFSSWPFIAVFLPITWAVFRLLQKHANREITLLWLVAASLFFYGWFKPIYLLIVLVSMAANYALGMMLAQKPWSKKKRKNLLIAGHGWAGFHILCRFISISQVIPIWRSASPRCSASACR
jgi:alginate O-acetyltransferase complex protein AlgI